MGRDRLQGGTNTYAQLTGWTALALDLGKCIFSASFPLAPQTSTVQRRPGGKIVLFALQSSPRRRQEVLLTMVPFPPPKKSRTAAQEFPHGVVDVDMRFH